ncbi:MAG: hypothetical protein IT174_11570 [Acidobacteria bacterium]|nr:hypothetical protein [Acidobacteriota bacterium]
MKNIAIKGLIVMFGICGLVVVLLITPADRVVRFMYGSQVDEIELKRIETNWIKNTSSPVVQTKR